MVITLSFGGPCSPAVWETKNPSVASHHPPVLIKLKDPTHFPVQSQYLLSLQNLRGLKPIISDLLRKGLLCPANSPYNTPILAVKKPNGTYRLVQILQIMNSTIFPLHPAVPNPYKILLTTPMAAILFFVSESIEAMLNCPLHRTFRICDVCWKRGMDFFLNGY